MDQRAPAIARRKFVQGVGVVSAALLAGCGQLPWQAPPAAKVPRIGVLVSRGTQRAAAADPAFLGALRDFGYVEGQNIAVEVRGAEGNEERLPELAAELVQLPVDVLVTPSEPHARVLRAATDQIPIVMVASLDPVGNGLIASLARPGGNITGLSQFGVRLAGKRVELFSETLPSGAELRALGPRSAGELPEVEVAAHALGLQMQLIEVAGPQDVEAALHAATSTAQPAFYLLQTPPIVASLERIAALTLEKHLPAISADVRFPAFGGLMAYGPSQADLWRRSAIYVDKILKGAKPADLPVEQPTIFEFVINLKTAQALGLTIPYHVLLQATEIIQ